MRLGRTIPGACFVGLAAALLTAPLRADEPASVEESSVPAAAHALPSFLLVTVTGEMAPPPSFEARVLSWFAESTARLDSVRRSSLDSASVLGGPARAGVQVWLLPRDATSVRLFFSVRDASGNAVRYLMTDFALEHGMDEVGLEQVAQVIYLSATALWEGRLESSRQEIEQGLSEARPAAPVAPAREPEPAPRAPVRSPERPLPVAKPEPLRVDGGLAYALRFRGDEGLAHGPSGLVSVTTKLGELELGGQARVWLMLPSVSRRRGVELELLGYSFSVGPTLTRAISERVSLGAELGAGFDWVRFAASAERDSGWQTDAAEWEVRPILTASAGARTSFGWLHVSLSGQLVVQLFDTRYEVVEPSGQSLLLAPWTAQPGVALEVTW